MDSDNNFLPIFLLILLALLMMGLGAIQLIGWLSAQTRPATVTVIAPTPTPSSPPEPSEWQVTEVITGDRLKMLRQDQEVIVKLACITVNPEPTQARYAGDRLRGLTLVGDPTFKVTELGVEADGTLLAELWVTGYGNVPQLAQAVLAGTGNVSVSPQAKALCPNASIMLEAQREAEKRRQPPRLIF